VKKIKKIITSSLKLVLILSIALTLLLFFYTIFFYNPNHQNNIKKNQISKKNNEIKSNEVEPIEKSKKELPKKIKPKKTEIKDGLYATVGSRAITKSDIMNEVKMILIVNNITYTAEQQNSLQRTAIKSLVTRNIKDIEIEKNNFLTINDQDLMNELTRKANNLGVDLETLKKICESQNFDFGIIENEVKTKLLWNSLIFHLYRDKLSINFEEIDEQLKTKKIDQNQNIEEFLISEILLKPESKEKVQSQVDELIEKIKTDGFKNAAIEFSISQTGTKGGDLGWLNKNQISKNFMPIIESTPIGEISKPIVLKDGILFFTVRNKRINKQKIDLEELKNQLVSLEKNKILDMYSMTHYDNLKRSVGVNFFNE